MKRKIFIIIIFLLLLTAPGRNAFLRCQTDENVISNIKNIPNPFRAGESTTVIRYVLSADCGVTITIYNLIGDKVIEFSETACLSGINQREWDGRNSLGRVVADGCYICLITAKDDAGKTIESEKHKIAVLK